MTSIEPMRLSSASDDDDRSPDINNNITNRTGARADLTAAAQQHNH